MDVVEQIYTVLQKRKYNREKPHLSDELRERIERFVAKNEPIELVGFWGIGPKTSANGADRKSCEFLQNLNEEVRRVYPPGIDFLFIFATEHAAHNGIDRSGMEKYINDIKKLFQHYGFRYAMLNELWDKYHLNFKKVEESLRAKPDGWWGAVENNTLIEYNAGRRNQRLPAREAAMRYYIFRDFEKEILKREYPDAIFHAFSDSRLRSVLPDMPTLYLYGQKGWSDAPWFASDNPKEGRAA